MEVPQNKKEKPVYTHQVKQKKDKDGGVSWMPLGDNIYCGVNDCDQLAYVYCDSDIVKYNRFKIFEGCGRKICMEHTILRKESNQGSYEDFTNLNTTDAN
jgi:hypothetical protein